MRRLVPVLLGTLVAAVVVAGPLAYRSFNSKNYRNFRTVRPGVLYRSGQLSLPGLKRIVNDHGVRHVISLRDADTPGQVAPDLAEEAYCKAEAIGYHRFSPKVWWSADGGPVPGQQNIDAFLRILDDPANHPVLLHCFAGCHRTGIHCAVFRMEFDRWTNDEAIDEMRRLGYDNILHEEDALTYLRTYVPRWQRKSSQAGGPG
jgi:protein tyrosine/serine phosphatase